MFNEDEHFITSSTVLFASNTALGRRFADLNGQIQSTVDALTDDEALSIDADDWAGQVARELEVEAPKVDIEGARVEHLGRIDVDCTGKPGIPYSLTELQVIRPGHRFRVRVPVTSESELLVARPSAGFEPLRADFADGCILRSWDWPEVVPPDSFDRSVEAFKHMLSQGALRVAQDVETGNASIVSSVRSALDARREAILAERTFLGSLSVPVKPAPGAPKPLRAPPIRSRSQLGAWPPSRPQRTNGDRTWPSSTSTSSTSSAPLVVEWSGRRAASLTPTKRRCAITCS